MVPTMTTFKPGDLAMQAWNPVRIHRAERKYRTDGYRVQRTVPEPVGYNRDGSIMSSVGLPFWVPATSLRPMPADGRHPSE